ncbi:MAG: hypothetical protein E7353_01925 [Clostridiales bacterium]|nr:hypothetical protein [Clostridiales bacterium]
MADYVITLHPGDEDEFVEELLKTKRAKRVLIYKDGSEKTNIWKADKFNRTSPLINNIHSYIYHRKDTDQIAKVDITICGAGVASKPKITSKPKVTVIDDECEKSEAEPICPPIQGYDRDVSFVYYAENVSDEEKVPGLCSYLRELYGRIKQFAGRILYKEFRYCSEEFFKYIPVILKKECPVQTHKNNYEFATKKINEITKEKGAISVDDLKNALYYKQRIAGMFFAGKEPHIEIYFNQFESSCYDEYLACVLNTLAHEYAHYLEFEYCGRKRGKKSNKGSCVSEAIADFFSVLFSVDKGDMFDLNVAEGRYYWWREMFGSGLSYSYAFYFVKNMPRPFHNVIQDYYDNDNISNLVNVFMQTPKTDIAYSTLVNL